MERNSFESHSLFLRGGRRRVLDRGIHAGSVHGGARSSGVHILQARQPLLVGAYRGGIGGSLSSGVGLGAGLGVGLGSGLGVGLDSGLDSGLGAVFGGSAGFRGATGFGSGSAFKVNAGFGCGTGAAAVGILGNEKFTMRVLNDRLASYLKKVHMLVKANAELELKISQFVDSRTSPTERNYSDSLTTISDLEAKILDAIRLKGVVFLNLDNATLAADDFRIKYENELAMRQTVVADSAGLKRLFDDIKLRMEELSMQINTLNEDRVYLKKSHEEEMVTTRSQMSGQIHVEMNPAPHENLTSVLEDIRDHYETITTRNRREVEAWFKSKMETLKQEVAVSTQTTETSKTETSTQKTKVQSLEVELQSVLAVKSSLAENLLERQAFYATHLSGYQLQVTSLEEQLMQLRADLERQSRNYEMLMDMKTRLELEIAEYRRLLDLGTSGSNWVASGKSSATKVCTTVKIEEKTEEKLT